MRDPFVIRRWIQKGVRIAACHVKKEKGLMRGRFLSLVNESVLKMTSIMGEKNGMEALLTGRKSKESEPHTCMNRDFIG